jgi:cytidyltransferase-like protein
MKLKREKIIVTIGAFDPVELSDLNFLKRAKSKGDWLIVGVHSDIYLTKYEKSFIQNYNSRSEIVRELKCVDEVFMYNDSDGTACQLLKIVQMCYPYSDIFFVSKNGDKETSPEGKMKGIKFLTMK